MNERYRVFAWTPKIHALGLLGENQFAQVFQRSPRKRPLAEVEQKTPRESPLAELDERSAREILLASVAHRPSGEGPMAVVGREAGCPTSCQSLGLQSKDYPA